MTHRENLVKSIISALTILLSAGLLSGLAGCTESADPPVTENPALAMPVPAGAVRGTVLQTMDSGGYTYVLIEAEQGEVWAAGPQATVQVGDVVQVPQGMPMNQFESKTLGRTFDVLYFVSAIANLTSPNAAMPASAGMSSRQPEAEESWEVRVDPLEPGQAIAWVYANKDSLAGQPVGLRGTVVKYNSNILGWNFIHIQDGSGDAAKGNHDLTVTSKAITSVGKTVELTGTLILDKDFGSGYRFELLLEDASLTSEQPAL